MEKEYSLLKIQYENLIKMYDLHHKRWNDHWKTFLTILAIITAILTTLIKSDSPGVYRDLIVFISIVGCIISVSAYITLNRIRNDADLVFYFLREIETKFSDNKKIESISIFQSGQELFNIGSYKDLKFKNNWLRRIKLIHIAFVSFSTFVILFVYLGFSVCQQ